MKKTADIQRFTQIRWLDYVFTIASRVQGLMLMELARQLPPFFSTGEDLYNREIERIIMEIRN